MPKEEHTRLYRLAAAAGISLAAFMRNLYTPQLERDHPEAAAEIKAAREKHRLAARMKAAAASVLVGGTILVMFDGTHARPIRVGGRNRRRDEYGTVAGFGHALQYESHMPQGVAA